jgi:hypothetical protein
MRIKFKSINEKKANKHKEKSLPYRINQKSNAV